LELRLLSSPPAPPPPLKIAVFMIPWSSDLRVCYQEIMKTAILRISAAEGTAGWPLGLRA
ncbi:MAG: hypothetical protein L0Y54_15300, partial [Sporichthyaceae bacterium]|nr:hypothetical protein [Sporichthyaceae bacterium]